MQNNKAGPFPPAAHNSELKMIHRPRLKTESMKVLEKNVIVYFHVVGREKILR